MNMTCQAANVHALISDPTIKPHIEELATAFETFASSDKQRTHIHSALSCIISDEMIGQPRQGLHREQALQPDIYTALLSYLNHEIGTAAFASYHGERRENQYFLSPQGILCSHVKIQGVKYQPDHISPGNANIVFSSPGSSTSALAKIIEIFLHTRRDLTGVMVEETFLAVQELLHLSNSEGHHDIFRQYSAFGGILYYADYSMVIQVFHPKDLICHFAKTPMEVQSISRPCFHVLPLDRVSYHIYHYPVDILIIFYR